MTPYPTYKHSGIEWIGEIPEHWEVNKFGRISYMKGRIGWQGLKQSEFNQNADNPFLITGMNFHSGKIRWDEVYHISDDRYNEAPEIQLKESDVLFTKDGTIGKLLFVDNIPYPHKASLNSHLLVLRPLNDEYFPRYLYYQLQSLPFKHHVELTKTGTTFYGITQEAMGQYKFLLPPLSEQQAIARFLDERTEKIDRLIANKQRLIELLREERTGLINQAVTRGLDKDTPLQPSGIDWLGDIPAHWEVKKLKYVVSKIDEIVDFSDFTIAVENIESYSGKLVGLDEEKNYSGALSAFRKNDVIFNKLRPYLCKVYFAEQDGACYGELLILRGLKKVINNHFLFFRLISDAFISEVNSSTEGTKMPRANWEDFIKHLFIPIPPIAEQQAIATYITKETRKIDHAIGRIEQEIALMQEYRAALISEVVTGKINVSEQNPKQRGKQQTAHHIGNLNDN